MSVNHLLYLYSGLPSFLGFTLLQSWFYLKRCVFQILETWGKTEFVSVPVMFLLWMLRVSRCLYFYFSLKFSSDRMWCLPLLGLTPKGGGSPSSSPHTVMLALPCYLLRDFQTWAPCTDPYCTEGWRWGNSGFVPLLPAHPPSNFYQIQPGSIYIWLNNRKIFSPKKHLVNTKENYYNHEGPRAIKVPAPFK